MIFPTIEKIRYWRLPWWAYLLIGLAWAAFSSVVENPGLHALAVVMVFVNGMWTGGAMIAKQCREDQ